MALDTIRREVSGMLSEVNVKLARAQTHLSDGAPGEKIDAAGELNFLHRQRDAIEARLKEIDAAPENASETLLEWVKEEVFNLKLRFDGWASGH